MSGNRVIPIGIPWTVRSAKRKKAQFIDFDEERLTHRQLARRVDVGGKIKNSQIINMYPDDRHDGYWHVKYRDDNGRIIWAHVKESDIG